VADELIEVIAFLIKADNSLASRAILDALATAEAAGCEEDDRDKDCRKAEREIDRAQTELTSALDAVDLESYESAIRAFRKAWQSAQKALAVFEDDEEDSDSDSDSD